MIALRVSNSVRVLFVHHQVEIALARPRFLVGEAVEFLRQRPHRLGEHSTPRAPSTVSSPLFVRNNVPVTPTMSPMSHRSLNA